ncbi:hypothetical protein [Psychromarinibacter sp. S121]|uniref:hypothetical protein n=1 Tax=Psychromarinibacter sp. S121 TaxID=3415127 RepID=UPI003C7D379C
MASKSNWIATVAKESAKLEVKMPWTRGARRDAFIAKRAAAAAKPDQALHAAR